jgi:hypothetical protein
MVGYSQLLEIEELKSKCDKLGFRLGHSKHGYYYKEYGDVVALFPKDNEALPVYNSDAELFVGTLAELGVWLRGVEWARNYDKLLFSDNIAKKRERKEQDLRNENLARLLKK